MDRLSKSTFGLLIAMAVTSCAGSRPQCDRELSSSDVVAKKATPPTAAEQRSGIARPPVVLNSGSETANYSYATGCYQAYQRICGKLSSDSLMNACREDGLSSCEKYAHEFGEWIRSGASPARK